MNVILQNISTWMLFLFLFLVTIPDLPISSVPLVLFALLCFADRRWTWDRLCDYRREIGLITVALLIGLMFSHLPAKSAKGLYDFLRGAVIFFPVLFLVRYYGNRFQMVLPWAALFAVLYLWVTVILSTKGILYDKGLVRSGFSPLVGHYNTYGTMAAVICFTTVSRLIHLPVVRRNVWILAATAAASFSLTIYSGSRGSTVSFAAAIFCVLLMRFANYRRIVLIAGMLSVVILGGAILSNQAGDYLESWQRNSKDLSSGRFAIYSEALTATWSLEPLTGFGPNSYKYLEHSHVANQKYTMPHSVYIESFYSLGFIGTGFLFAALVSLGLRISKAAPGFFLHLGAALVIFYLVRGTIGYKLFSAPYVGALAAGLGFILGEPEKVTSASTEDHNV